MQFWKLIFGSNFEEHLVVKSSGFPIDIFNYLYFYFFLVGKTGINFMLNLLV